MSRPPTRLGTPLQRLFQAVKDGDIRAVREFIKDNGAQYLFDLNLPGTGERILQAAVESCQKEMLQFLLDQLPSGSEHLNAKLWNGDSLLHLAVGKKGGNAEVVRLLLNHGADDDIRDWDGSTPLDRAFVEDRCEMVKVIITHGDDQNRTAELSRRYLNYAERDGRTDMKSALNDLVEPFDSSDPEYALYNAIITNNHTEIRTLFFQRVDPFALKFGKKQMSALHAAARLNDVRILAMLLARVDKMGRVDAADKDGRTPLHYAAEKNNISSLDWLLFAGADPDIEDKNRKIPQDLALERVKRLPMWDSCWDQIPDAIIVMHRDDWHHDLPRHPCSFYGAREQPPDNVIPPVLMVRCVTTAYDDYEELRPTCERSSFEVEELLVQAYEYRCSQPTVVGVVVTLEDLFPDSSSSSSSSTSFVFKCFDDRLTLIETETLDLEEHGEKREGLCDVELVKSGTLCLVRRVKHQVVMETVGSEERVIMPENLQGFRLQVPSNAFHEEQKIMIKVEEPFPKPKQHNEEIEAPRDADVGAEAELEPKIDTSIIMDSIQGISCFYTILNSANEKPHKALPLDIPMATKGSEGTKVVSLFMSHTSNPDNLGQGDLAAARVPSLDPVAEQPSGVGVACEEGAESGWRLTDDVSVSRQHNSVSTSIDNAGVVVAAEVRAETKNEEIIQQITDLYNKSRQNKKEILIFAVAQPYPQNMVEVMLCAVSSELYDATLDRLLTQKGYRRMKEPIVAYAYNREIFSLKLRGNFTDIYMDSESDAPTLEYQVGGRLNHTTFVLKLANPAEAAVGAISVERRTSQNSPFTLVGIVHLDLTSYFTQRGGGGGGGSFFSQLASAEGKRSKLDELVVQLSQTLSTDNTRVYCHALGLTKKVMTETLKVPKGHHMSPSEKNYRLLSETRSNFRSEPAFRKSLLDTLTKHKDRPALKIIQTIFPPKSSKKPTHRPMRPASSSDSESSSS